MLIWKWKWKSLSRFQLFVTPWTIQSMEFSRPEYWSEYPFPSPGDLLKPGIELRFHTLQLDSLPTEPQRKPIYHYGNLKNYTKMTLFILFNYNNKVWTATHLWQHDLLNILSDCWDLLLRNRLFSKYYCSLTMHLVTQELWWRWAIRVLFLCLLTKHPFCSPCIKE